jgi:hypothetical protein
MLAILQSYLQTCGFFPDHWCESSDGGAFETPWIGDTAGEAGYNRETASSRITSDQ